MDAYDAVKELEGVVWNLKLNIEAEATEVYNVYQQELRLKKPDEKMTLVSEQDKILQHLRDTASEWTTTQYEIEALFAKTGMSQKWLMDNEWVQSKEAQAEDVVQTESSGIKAKLAAAGKLSNAVYNDNRD